MKMGWIITKFSMGQNKRSTAYFCWQIIQDFLNLAGGKKCPIVFIKVPPVLVLVIWRGYWDMGGLWPSLAWLGYVLSNLSFSISLCSRERHYIFRTTWSCGGVASRQTCCLIAKHAWRQKVIVSIVYQFKIVPISSEKSYGPNPFILHSSVSGRVEALKQFNKYLCDHTERCAVLLAIRLQQCYIMGC